MKIIDFGAKYHCSVNRRNTLCGKTIGWESEPVCWDFPARWLVQTEAAINGYSRCKKCLAHPDLPLLALGATDEDY